MKTKIPLLPSRPLREAEGKRCQRVIFCKRCGRLPGRCERSAPVVES